MEESLETIYKRYVAKGGKLFYEDGGQNVCIISPLSCPDCQYRKTGTFCFNNQSEILAMFIKDLRKQRLAKLLS